MIPHVNFTGLGGFKFPWVVRVPSTNVAESAEVIKKVAMRNMAIKDIMVPSGYCSRTVNKATSRIKPEPNTNRGTRYRVKGG